MTEPSAEPAKPVAAAPALDRVLDRWGLAALLALYFALSIFLVFHWHARKLNMPNGDEPQYLVMAQGIARYRSLEQTRPYLDAFRENPAFWQQPPGAMPTPDNSNTARGPHGLYNIHNAGLPLLLAAPVALKSSLAFFEARLTMIALGSWIVVLAWRMARRFAPGAAAAWGATLAVAIAMPLVSGANQVYPDLLAGALCLEALLGLMAAREKLPSWPRTAALACSLAFLPWLQIKFAAPALLLTAAIALRLWLADRGRARAIFAPALVAASLSALAAYNQYAFGKASGPYGEGALEVSRMSFMVFWGLLFDQNQGMLIQNPVFFIGLFSVGLLFRRDWLAGTTWALVFLSLVTPNAMHVNWYGGFSFSGRFMWAGAVVFMAPTLLGLGLLAERRPRTFRAAVALGAAFQAFLYYQYAFVLKRLILNQCALYWVWKDKPKFPLPQDYSLFFRRHGGWRWLPELYDARWAYHYAPNYVFAIIVAGVLALGFVAAWRRENH